MSFENGAVIGSQVAFFFSNKMWLLVFHWLLNYTGFEYSNKIIVCLVTFFMHFTDRILKVLLQRTRRLFLNRRMRKIQVW